MVFYDKNLKALGHQEVGLNMLRTFSTFMPIAPYYNTFSDVAALVPPLLGRLRRVAAGRIGRPGRAGPVPAVAVGLLAHADAGLDDAADGGPGVGGRPRGVGVIVVVVVVDVVLAVVEHGGGAAVDGAARLANVQPLAQGDVDLQGFLTF